MIEIPDNRIPTSQACVQAPLIVLEGIDGSGTITQAPRLMTRRQHRGGL